MTINHHHHHHHHHKQKQHYHHDHPERCLKASSNRGERVDREEAGGGERKEGAGPEDVDFVIRMTMIVDVIDDNHHCHGASPNSNKHFFPYMGFCASIWNNVRHHCHHHHHHHHIQKSKSINTEACLIAH